MKKIATLLLIAISCAANAGNWVTVPDSLFRVYIASIAPGAIAGDSMNITNAGVLSATSINISGLGIASIEGVEYFTSLTTLNVGNNKISVLPTLSNTLTYLNIDSNQINVLGILPSHLNFLFCNNNQLVEIDSLPTHLQQVDCRNNKLLCLPVLPDSLLQLKAAQNYITCIRNQPVLPAFTSDVAYNVFFYTICGPDMCTRYDSIGGYVFLDLNHNGQRDAGEPGLSNLILTMQPLGQTAETDSSGYYYFYGHPGIAETITPPVLSRATVAPDSTVILIANPLTDSSGINFGYFYPTVDSFSDIRVLGSEVIPASPGQPTAYELVVNNHGAITERGKLTFIISPLFTYQSSSPAATVSGNTLTWDFTNLYPGTNLYYHIDLNVNSGDAIGTSFSQTAFVDHFNYDSILTVDSVPHNDTLVLADTIARTYPRNNKTVTPARYNGANFAAGDFFNYTITFQNTDTSTATNVWIIDSLNQYFDMSTLYVVSASASYRLTITGHVLRVDFDNINLPDTASSQLHSRGFFTFMIRPLTANFVGQIHNTAYIYFDGKTLSPPPGTGLTVCLSALQISMGSNPETISYCGSNTLGSATVVAFNGSPPYSYLWSTGSTTTTSGSMPFGEYYVTVTDQCIITAVGMVFVDSFMAAGCNTWMGLSPDWFDGNNWSNGSSPGSCGDDAYVPAGRRSYPVLGANATTGNLKVYSGADIDLNGYNLTICGNWTGGSGNYVNVIGDGEVIFTGTGSQTISGNTQFGKMVVDNSAGGVHVTGSINISEGLIMQQGNVTNGGQVVLLSSALGDAYLDDFSNGGAGAYIGNIDVQRYVANSSDGYRDLSSPVNTTVANLASAFPIFGQNGVDCWYDYNPYPNVQVYNESLNNIDSTSNYYTGWVSYTGLSNPMTAMKGVAARTYQGSPYTVNFFGPPYTGPQSTNITYTPSGTPGADGWNFIGNPYPSPILWSSVRALNGGATDGSYYVFHTTGEYTGNWGSNNGTTGVNGAANQISSGQGFFVLTSANNSVSMDNSVRTITPAGFFGLNNALENEVRLTLTGAGNSDEIVTYTDPHATAGYDAGYDAVKMVAGNTVYLSYNIQNRQYAINVMDSVTTQTELPLVISVADTGNYVLEATTLNTPGLNAFLKDAQSGVLTNLSVTSPSLALNGNQTYTGRYSVVFSAIPDTTVTTGILNSENSPVRIYSSGNTVYIKRQDKLKANISIVNILGQNIVEAETADELTSLPLDGPQVWYAIVKVTQGSKVTVAKVLITEK